MRWSYWTAASAAPMTRRRVAAVGLILAALAGCGGGSSSPSDPALGRPAPDLQSFLRLPVATPSACPPTENGTTIDIHRGSPTSSAAISPLTALPI